MPKCDRWYLLSDPTIYRTSGENTTQNCKEDQKSSMDGAIRTKTETMQEPLAKTVAPTIIKPRVVEKLTLIRVAISVQ